MRWTPEKYEEMDLAESAYRPPEIGIGKPLTIFLILCAVGALIYVLKSNPL